MSKQGKLKEFAKIFDHTNLHPDATREDIESLCKEARDNGFGAVCVNPYYVKLSRELLEGSDVEVCTVIGFPLGATNSEVKAFEVKQAVSNGAVELDMVLNIGAMKDGVHDVVKKDIAAVVQASGEHLTKVILETCFLTKEEIKKACELAKDAGADFVKTSTGFGPEGAKIAHVKLMRETVGKDMGVKASGGIRTYEKAKAIVEAGASRIGASSSVKILEEYKKRLSE